MRQKIKVTDSIWLTVLFFLIGSAPNTTSDYRRRHHDTLHHYHPLSRGGGGETFRSNRHRKTNSGNQNMSVRIKNISQEATVGVGVGGSVYGCCVCVVCCVAGVLGGGGTS